jgi:hypothetical protein
MAKVIITASGGVTTHDLLSTYLCGDLYMLANRETKNISWSGKSEAISMFTRQQSGGETGQNADTAVFGDIIIFSLSGYCFHSFGSRTGFLTKQCA